MSKSTNMLNTRNNRSTLEINPSTPQENLREIGALTEILRDELMSNLGVQQMVVIAMTDNGPMMLRHDPTTGTLHGIPIELNSSVEAALS